MPTSDDSGPYWMTCSVVSTMLVPEPHCGAGGVGPDVWIVGLLEELGLEVVGPLRGSDTESGNWWPPPHRRRRGFVVSPLDARGVRLQVLVVEAALGVAAADLLELCIGPAVGGCEHVDQVAGRRSQVAGRFAIGEGMDLGPDCRPRRSFDALSFRMQTDEPRKRI